MKQLILLHGALGAASQFDELKVMLSDTFEVHTFNFAGHGGSELPGAFSIEEFAKELLRYVEEHQLQQPDVFGYSMGGYVALQLAANHPGMLGDIITLGTKFGWTPESSGNEVKKLNSELIEEKVPKFAAQLSARHAPQDWKEIMRMTASMMLDLGNEKAMVQSDFEKINNRVVILLGSEDNMVTQEESRRVSEWIPNARFELLEGVKHPIEMVEKFLLIKIIKSSF